MEIIPINMKIDIDDCTDRPISRIHIRVQQRNGKKCITLIEGLAEDLNLPKIVKIMKKTFQTSGAIIKNDNDDEIIQLGGDQRESARQFMLKYKIWESPDPPIKIHGY